MTIDAERYKICIRCMDEERTFCISDATRDELEQMARNGFKWQNPFCIKSNKDLSHQICIDCAYILEHTVLAQEEVYAHG